MDSKCQLVSATSDTRLVNTRQPTDDDIIKRSRVTNDYILMEILSYIDIQDLFKYQVISKQFNQCIQSVLEIQKQLSIGISDSFESVWTYKSFLCGKSDHKLIANEYYKNNITAAVCRSGNIFQLFQSIGNLTTIFENCIRVECLALKDCYLDIYTINTIGQYMKNLKCLSLFDCFISMKAFTGDDSYYSNQFDRIVHMSVHRLYDIDGNHNKVIDIGIFIKQFRNIHTLYAIVDKQRSMKRLIQSLPITVRKVILNLEDTSLDRMYLINTFNDTIVHRPQIRSIQCLNIADYYLNANSLKVITENMNLRRFWFSCRSIDWSAITTMANKLQELEVLGIYWSTFRNCGPNDYIECRQKLSKVKCLIIHDSILTAYLMRQLIQLFPIVTKVQFTSNFVRCGNHMVSCLTCRNLCFEYISIAKTIKTLVIMFEDITDTFVNSLYDYPNIRRLLLLKYWTSIESKSKIIKYDTYLRQIIVSVLEICQQRRKQNNVFIIWINDNVVVPQDIDFGRHIVFRRSKLL